MRRDLTLLIRPFLLLLVVFTWSANSALAATPLFTECPAIGQADTGCATLIDIAADGSVSFATDPNQPPLDTGVSPEADDMLLGVLNESCKTISSVPLSSNSSIFQFDGDGVCGSIISPQPAGCPFGPTRYEGPGTSFTVNTPFSGSVNFTSGLAPNSSTFFSLEANAGTQLVAALGTNTGSGTAVLLTAPALGSRKLVDVAIPPNTVIDTANPFTDERVMLTVPPQCPLFQNPLPTVPLPTCAPAVVQQETIVIAKVLDAKVSGIVSRTDSSAFVDEAVITVPIPSVPTITIRKVLATSETGLCSKSGATTIAFLQLGTSAPLVNFQPPPNTSVLNLPGVATLVLNEQIPTPNGLTVNAIHLNVPALEIDVIISQAVSGFQAF